MALSWPRRPAANWRSWVLVVCSATRPAIAPAWSSSRSMPVVNATSAVLNAAGVALAAGDMEVAGPTGPALEPQAASAPAITAAQPGRPSLRKHLDSLLLACIPYRFHGTAVARPSGRGQGPARCDHGRQMTALRHRHCRPPPRPGQQDASSAGPRALRSVTGCRCPTPRAVTGCGGQERFMTGPDRGR